ncbi:CRISPR-associated protein Cas4 [Thiolapillus sp.]|uniref:CRISPR-associated protein Cas4 n=8 Tax=Thiolapillus sp. TaxID=2017437 RepID=UPI00273A25DA|nr:CRISPR-associated protein Cas4 [Thiolapillus sp.]
MPPDPMAEPIMLSALQHYSYCPRQCALIHQEQSFDDNEYTLRGQRAHRRVDSGEISTEDGRQVLRALPLYSDRLGLVGKADVVEFLPDGTPYPVEYKQGKRHKHDHDDIQLAAQALCLEEMIGCVVSEGAIYHHKSKRRRVVHITDRLRQQVETFVDVVRHLLKSGGMPPPADDASLCRACSLHNICQPELVGSRHRIHDLSKHLFEVDESSQ